VQRTSQQLACCWTSQAGIAAELAAARTRRPGRVEAVVRRVTSAAGRRAAKLLNIKPNHKVDRLVLQFREEILAAHRVLRRHRPTALVVGEDGVSGNAPLIKAAHDAGLVVMVIPYEVSGREDFDNYLEEKHREGRLLTLDSSADDLQVAGRFPHWTRETPYGRAVIYPPHYIIAREIARLGVPDPFTPQGGSADYLAVESEAMHDHYRREGLPEEKILPLGSPYCDVLADVLASDKAAAQGMAGVAKIVPGRTRILVSLPPSYHETRPGTNEFSTYEAMCRGLIDACASIEGAELTLSIHPATPPEQRAMLERMSATIIPEWLIRLIPRHDVVVTTFSSTIRWALACGKPVINYDAYQFRLDVFREARAMTTVYRAADVAAMLTNLADDESYGRAAERAAVDARRWGVLDGENTQRIVTFLKRARRRNAFGPIRRILETVGLS